MTYVLRFFRVKRNHYVRKRISLKGNLVQGQKLRRWKFMFAGVAVLLCGAAFRLISLHDVPPGLAPDEVLNADIVTAILNGEHALFFRQGYGHEPLYHYLQTPFRILFGDNFLSIRLPAVYLGLLLIALSMMWIRRDFGTVAGVVAGVGIAVSWWPIVFSRLGIRPILEPVLLVAAAWFWQRRPWLAGVLLGLTLYTYTAARVTLFIPLLFAAYCYVFGRHRDAGRAKARSSLIILLVAVVFYLPLHLTLASDPSLQERVNQLSGPLTALQEGDFRPVSQLTLATLGVFSFTGDPRTTYSVPGRPLFDPLTSVLFFAGLLIAIWRSKQSVYIFILIWLAVTMLPSAVTPKAPSLVRLIGAIPVVYLFPGLSAQWLMRRLRQRRSIHTVKRPVLYASYAGLLGLLALNCVLTVRDGFVTWPMIPKTRRLYHSVYLDIARHFDENPGTSPVVGVGFYTPLEHHLLRLNLGYDIPARWVQSGNAIVIPNSGNGRFYVPEFTPPDPKLLKVANIPDTPIFRSEGPHSFAIYTLADSPEISQLSEPVNLEDTITFLGYKEVDCSEGESLQLFTYWRVEAPLPWDLAIFVHLLDADGSVVTQHDGLDAAATRMYPGDRFVQRHELPPPDAEVSSPNILQLGAYLRTDGRRLLHEGQSSDRIILSTDYDFCNSNIGE